MADTAIPTDEDPVIAGLESLRDPEDAPTPLPTTPTTPASTPGPQSNQKGGSVMDPDDIEAVITAALANALKPLNERLEGLEKGLADHKGQNSSDKDSKKGSALTARDEANADYVAEKAREAYLDELQRQDKEERKRLGKRAAAGATIAAGGTVDMSIFDDEDDAGTFVQRPQYPQAPAANGATRSDDELVSYYREHKVLPAGVNIDAEQDARIKPRMDEIDKKSSKRRLRMSLK